MVYGKVTKRLPLVVGQNWMLKIRLDWFAIKQVRGGTLWESLQAKYQVFKGTLGDRNYSKNGGESEGNCKLFSSHDLIHITKAENFIRTGMTGK